MGSSPKSTLPQRGIIGGAFASYAVARRKRLEAIRKEELRSSLADIGKVVSLLILTALIAPVLVIILSKGVVVVVLPIIAILIVVLYGWRSREIANRELEKIFKAFADSLAQSFKKSECRFRSFPSCYEPSCKTMLSGLDFLLPRMSFPIWLMV
jgi:uncharacterized protein YacL